MLLGLFGFSGIVTAAAGPAKMLACLFLVAFLVSLMPPITRNLPLTNRRIIPGGFPEPFFRTSPVKVHRVFRACLDKRTG
jgi:uncharacterized membrane protein YtjA (UPF0391 family)